MKKQLVFLDIDGTLVEGGENEPRESALKALREAKANGHKMFLCSGRNEAMLAPLLKYDFDGYVASAGGYVVCDGEVIYDHPMTREQYETAIRLLHKHSAVCTVEARDASYGDRNIEELFSVGLKGELNSELLRWKKAIDENLSIRPLEEYDGRPVYKIVMMANDMSQIAEARAALEDAFDFCFFDDGRFDIVNGEMINRAFDKGRGIERICKFLEHPMEDTIGFGDSMNDLQMMQTVGLSVCMESGSKKLIEISDLTTAPPDEDGIYKAFRALGLI